jgi:hypothetical protein
MRSFLSENEFDDYGERAAILEFNAGMGRSEAEKKALALVLGKRAELPGRAALSYMCASGYKLIGRFPSAAAIASGEDYENAFTSDWCALEGLIAGRGDGAGRAKGAVIRRFDWRPADYGYIAFDIDRNHSDGADGIAELYRALEAAGKPRSMLPAFLDDIELGSHPCYVSTPSGGLHLYFRHRGTLAIKNLANGVETKYNRLTITAPGSAKQNGVYTLHGNFSKAPELPQFLEKLITKPKPVYRYFQRVQETPELSRIASWTETDEPNSGRNVFANRYAGKAARHGCPPSAAFEFLQNYHKTASLPERELRAAVNSGYKFGRTAQ